MNTPPFYKLHTRTGGAPPPVIDKQNYFPSSSSTSLAAPNLDTEPGITGTSEVEQTPQPMVSTSLMQPPNLLAQWAKRSHLTCYHQYDHQGICHPSRWIQGTSNTSEDAALKKQTEGEFCSNHPLPPDRSGAAGTDGFSSSTGENKVSNNPDEDNDEALAGGSDEPEDDAVLIDLYDYGHKAKIGISKNKRAEQQDAFFIFQDGEEHYFGVIDGHGPEGGWVAAELQNKVPEFLRSCDGDMFRAFEATEAYLAEDSRSYCSGAAIAVVHVNPEIVECWHLGDCRVLFGSRPLTDDHSVRNLSFQERMSLSTKTGARFLSGNTRVTLSGAPGSLELMRCFGDRWGKETGLFSAIPDHIRVTRPEALSEQGNHDQKVSPDILVASDGVFGVLDNVEVCEELQRTKARSQEEAAASGATTNPVEAVMRRAIEQRSTDNITCVGIFTRKIRRRASSRRKEAGLAGTSNRSDTNVASNATAAAAAPPPLNVDPTGARTTDKDESNRKMNDGARLGARSSNPVAPTTTEVSGNGSSLLPPRSFDFSVGDLRDKRQSREDGARTHATAAFSAAALRGRGLRA
ncbi:unnamed protein product [Amoebophrya sp. A120]|nr:unnamed protein product [Amoebophrya sp. A120]|eukprot:GSA120T00005923001.1